MKFVQSKLKSHEDKIQACYASEKSEIQLSEKKVRKNRNHEEKNHKFRNQMRYNRSNINKLIEYILPQSNKNATSSSLCSILYELCRFQDSRFNKLLSSIYTDDWRHSHDSECRRTAALEVFEWIKVYNL